jgi:hypothetical protein
MGCLMAKARGGGTANQALHPRGKATTSGRLHLVSPRRLPLASARVDLLCRGFRARLSWLLRAACFLRSLGLSCLFCGGCFLFFAHNIGVPANRKSGACTRYDPTMMQVSGTWIRPSIEFGLQHRCSDQRTSRCMCQKRWRLK